MEFIIISALLGLLGAVIRILVVLIRAGQLNQSTSPQGVFVYSMVALFSGLFSGIIFSLESYPLLAVLAGYAGFDLMDRYYDTFKKKKVTFKAN